MTGDHKLDVVLFDVDETLYPRNAGLMQAIGGRIQAYMEDRLGLDRELVSRLRVQYVKEYGTSLRGLHIHYHVDPEDYLAYVHDVPLKDYISPNPELGLMLRNLRPRKVIFTNATEEHARSVAGILGVEQLFEQIIDVRTFDYVGKPYRETYEKVVDRLGVPAGRCLLVDDAVRNLRPGKELGMLTVLVGDHAPEDDVVDFHLPSVLGVGEVVGQLEGSIGQCGPKEVKR